MSSEQESSSKPESGLWKDYLDRRGVTRIAESIAKVLGAFDSRKFVSAVFVTDYEKLELKARIARLAEKLHDQMPGDYRTAAPLLIKIAPDLNGFGNWVLTAYVEKYGVEHLPESIPVLRELTKYGSSEFAVRPFIIRYTDKMLPVLHQWAQDSNEHVRRLAAEGSRPRGVWTQHIEAFRRDPRPVVELLNRLKADRSLYVRKAVANNLNDISKDHADIAIAVAARWAKDQNPLTGWIIKQGCRTLVKQGNKEIFPILGFDHRPKVKVGKFLVSPARLPIGAGTTLTCSLKSHASSQQKLIIDYRVTFCRAGGKTASKVFKWSVKPLTGGGTLTLSTRHKFADGTTRKHFPGRHAFTLLINGVEMASAHCTLAR